MIGLTGSEEAARAFVPVAAVMIDPLFAEDEAAEAGEAGERSTGADDDEVDETDFNDR